jgi:hypothetical protein
MGVELGLYLKIYAVVSTRVLMKIFGPKMEEVTGDWRKLYN